MDIPQGRFPLSGALHAHANAAIITLRAHCALGRMQIRISLQTDRAARSLENDDAWYTQIEIVRILLFMRISSDLGWPNRTLVSHGSPWNYFARQQQPGAHTTPQRLAGVLHS